MFAAADAVHVRRHARIRDTPGGLPLAQRRRESSVSVDSDRQVMDAVIAYLAECPNAMDTKLGVTEWWLMRHHVRVQVEAVGRALARLVADGVLETIGAGDGCRYRLKHQ
jgi:hypothetical protein